MRQLNNKDHAGLPVLVSVGRNKIKGTISSMSDLVFGQETVEYYLSRILRNSEGVVLCKLAGNDHSTWSWVTEVIIDTLAAKVLYGN